MKAQLIAPALIGLMLASIGAPVFASGDCPLVPRAQWKPEADARAATEALGYRVAHIRAGDGCYEVWATGKHGRAAYFKFAAADMKLVSRVTGPDVAMR